MDPKKLITVIPLKNQRTILLPQELISYFFHSMILLNFMRIKYPHVTMGCGFLGDTEGLRLCNPITCRGMWKRAGNSASKIESCASRPGKPLRGTKSESSASLKARSHRPRAQMICTLTRCGKEEKLCGC